MAGRPCTTRLKLQRRTPWGTCREDTIEDLAGSSIAFNGVLRTDAGVPFRAHDRGGLTTASSLLAAHHRPTFSASPESGHVGPAG